MPRPIRALVDTQALSHNLAVARKTAPGCKVWAVVKANAYGHDIDMVYPAFKDADGFALLDFDEAIRVRNLGWTGPILLLEGFFEASDLQMVVDYDLTPAVSTDEQLDMLAAFHPPRPIPIYLKMNSGMNRLGWKPHLYRAAWERARTIPSVGSIALMTHFAEADGERGVKSQLEAFNTATQGLDGIRCLSNSAATLWHAQAHGNWVRPGVMLYGGSPSGVAADVAGTLQPAMTLESRLIGVQDLKAGDAVGYGAIFTADRDMRVGVVACGYADGYSRTAPAGTPVIVDGIRTRVVGRVSMDMLTVDLTACPNAGIGSHVELWGKQLPIDEVASHFGTIGYELMTAVAPRVKRYRV